MTELRKRFDDSFQLANQKESALAARADSVKVGALARFAGSAIVVPANIEHRSLSLTL